MQWMLSRMIVCQYNVENTVHLTFLFLLYKSSKKLLTSAILLDLNIENWRF